VVLLGHRKLDWYGMHSSRGPHGRRWPRTVSPVAEGPYAATVHVSVQGVRTSSDPVYSLSKNGQGGLKRRTVLQDAPAGTRAPVGRMSPVLMQSRTFHGATAWQRRTTGNHETGETVRPLVFPNKRTSSWPCEQPTHGDALTFIRLGAR
jgi:hypothetical protein